MLENATLALSVAAYCVPTAGLYKHAAFVGAHLHDKLYSILYQPDESDVQTTAMSKLKRSWNISEVTTEGQNRECTPRG